MVIYILTFVVFAAILLFSYRALGGEPASPDAVERFFENVVDWVREDASTLGALGLGQPIDEETVESARNVRKKLAGYQQQLARLDPDEPKDSDEHSARATLSRAIESLGWACRMVEAGSYQINPAVREATASLYVSATASLAPDALRVPARK